MLTYQVRPRLLRTSGTALPQFPAQGEVCFHLGPPQPFGRTPGGGRTGVRAVPANVLFNANSGEHTIVSTPSLQPLDVTLAAPDRVVRLYGTELSVSQQFDSAESIASLIDAIYFAIPALLNVDFADAPVVERVDGAVAGVPFRWELENWQAQFWMTTQDEQEGSFAKAWERLSLLSVPQNRRLFAALHYFHVSVRLLRVAGTAGEFLPEVLLNLSKVLEVLFPPSGNGRTRDAVRRELVKLDFADDQIEGDYLPAMALRNEIDVGHVDLSVFSRDELQLIHGYTARAEYSFRLLLKRLLERVEAKTYALTPYDLSAAEGSAAKVIARLRQHAGRGAP